MPAVAFPEKAVVEIWRQHLTGRTDLETEDGQPIRIVYPGMVSGDRGGDFVDAVIRTGLDQLQGSVEVHVNSSGWWGHGHHKDPAYNNVILHVVYRQDRERVVRLQNGKSIPTLVLDRFVKSGSVRDGSIISPAVFSTLPCRDIVHRPNGVILEKILNTAGEERFNAKIGGFKAEISQAGAAQTLYAAFMEALGYAKNKSQMKTLAGLLPLSKLGKLMDGYSPDEDSLSHLQALLLGTAGLLPSQRPAKMPVVRPVNSWIKRLEIIWGSFGETPKMFMDDWRFFKVRPGNHPTRRLAAMGCLLFRYREIGILNGLLDVIHQKDEGPDNRVLEEALCVADVYADNNTGYSQKGNRNIPALLGRGRAADIIVNTFLPLAAARGELESHPEQTRRAVEIYRQYPRLAPNNLERHMSNQFGIDRGRVTSARQQQGLIHIYRTFCIRGKCPGCPLIARGSESRHK